LAGRKNCHPNLSRRTIPDSGPVKFDVRLIAREAPRFSVQKADEALLGLVAIAGSYLFLGQPLERFRLVEAVAFEDLEGDAGHVVGEAACEPGGFFEVFEEGVELFLRFV
jgi:hypothetical protein